MQTRLKMRDWQTVYLLTLAHNVKFAHFMWRLTSLKLHKNGKLQWKPRNDVGEQIFLKQKVFYKNFLFLRVPIPKLSAANSLCSACILVWAHFSKSWILGFVYDVGEVSEVHGVFVCRTARKKTLQALSKLKISSGIDPVCVDVLQRKEARPAMTWDISLNLQRIKWRNANSRDSNSKPKYF